jgi:5-(aminomethyl)-3-furanmethanol phosphate kinase
MAGKESSGTEAPVIVKVGGSLLDLPGVGPRLRSWLDTLGAPDLLIVPGGGATANAIRTLDRRHGLGEEAAHWLALRALSLNAAVLQALLPASQVIDDWHDAAALCRRGVVPILDAFHFAWVDEECAGHLPHCWDVTSDSLAARVAVIAQARELILLKSVTIPESMCWAKAAQCGYVDPMFAQTCSQGGSGLSVRAVNFRCEFSPNGP